MLLLVYAIQSMKNDSLFILLLLDTKMLPVLSYYEWDYENFYKIFLWHYVFIFPAYIFSNELLVYKVDICLENKKFQIFFQSNCTINNFINYVWDFDCSGTLLTLGFVCLWIGFQWLKLFWNLSLGFSVQKIFSFILISPTDAAGLPSD